MGVNIYDVAVPCERAVVFGGFWENPSVFKDSITYVFYKKRTDTRFHQWRHSLNVDILRLYYDNMFNVTDMSDEQTVNFIRKTLEAEESGNTDRDYQFM